MIFFRPTKVTYTSLIVFISMITNTTDNDFNELLSGSDITLLIFKADWCNPCKLYNRELIEFSITKPEIRIGLLNVDNNPILPEKNGIRSIPSTIIYKKGALITKIPGIITKERLLELTDNLNY